jgi:F-type H+-transporting ATPase subunit a
VSETDKRWRWGVNRWLIVFLIVLSVVLSGIVAPIMPHIQLPAERIIQKPLFTFPGIGEFYLSNTLMATFLADLVLILIAIAVRRDYRSGKQVFSGITNVVEAVIEVLYNMVESTAGKWAFSILPVFATIILLVLVANWMELIPGVDTIGFLEHSEHGYKSQEVISGIETIVKQTPGQNGAGYVLVPFLRAAATDLNFTLGLALISVIMTQVIGFRALGPQYFTKFLNFGSFFKMWSTQKIGPFDVIFPFINIFVGILETVAEFAKVLSFSFRLFGNIFAGAVLLFVLGSLLPSIEWGIIILELFFGLIQALVFGMLTMVFMTMAVQSHHAEKEESHA